jgi:hypothetical protein
MVVVCVFTVFCLKWMTVSVLGRFFSLKRRLARQKGDLFRLPGDLFRVLGGLLGFMGGAFGILGDRFVAQDRGLLGGGDLLRNLAPRERQKRRAAGPCVQRISSVFEWSKKHLSTRITLFSSAKISDYFSKSSFYSVK